MQNASAFRFARGEKMHRSHRMFLWGGLILSQITSFGMKERGSSVTVSQGSLYDWKDTIKTIFYCISNKRCLTPWAPLSDPG